MENYNVIDYFNYSPDLFVLITPRRIGIRYSATTSLIKICVILLELLNYRRKYVIYSHIRHKPAGYK